MALGSSRSDVSEPGTDVRTRHSTRGGLSLMSETEFSQSPEGHPPEQPGQQH